jgi:RNA polymerase sigma factor (sigma-70 family)
MSESRLQPRPTMGRERRLIAEAKRGDQTAQVRLLAEYEPMVRKISRQFILPGGEREDLAQEARWGVVEAVRAWDPARGVPFYAFAKLCAIHEAQMAVTSASARKHRVLTDAAALDVTRGVLNPDSADGSMSERSNAYRERNVMTLPVPQEPDRDPVAKTLARERLSELARRFGSLTILERQALAVATLDHSHREIASTLRIGPRSVNNALQRGREKLREPLAA